MKATAEVKQERGSLGVSEIRMGIHQDAHAVVTSILTKMYANPLLACVREYSTNARDAMIEAGNADMPIEVTLPTRDKPEFRVRDWGTGLDADGIAEIYSQYGASTKRNTNAQNGMMGIGCKSALAYTEQFRVTAIKDGTLTQALVSYDEDGVGKFSLLDAKPTDLPNGVEVIIPIRKGDVDECRELADNFYRFWPAHHVLIDGHQPGGFKALTGIWLDDHTLLTGDVDEDLVVMGGVAYPLVDGEAPLFANPRANWRDPGYHAVCFVPIGSVSFAPSRETLMTTKRTTETLAHLRDKVAKLRDDSVRAQIAAAPSAADAQRLMIEGGKVGYDGNGATWQGHDVVLTLTREQPSGVAQYSSAEDWPVEVALQHSYLHTNLTRYTRKNGERSNAIDLTRTGFLIFVGFDGKAMTNVKRAKLELWWEKHPDSAYPPHEAAKFNQPNPRKTLPSCVFIDKLSDHEKFWLNGRPIYQWADVDATVLPKQALPDGTTTRLKGSYDIIRAGQNEHGVAAQKIADAKLPIYWYHGNVYTAGFANELRSGAIDKTTCVVVCLPGNRIEKFCRDFPGALKLMDAARKAAETWDKTQDQEVAKAYWIQQNCHTDWLKTLDITKIDDPDLKALRKMLDKRTRAYADGRGKWGKYLVADKHEKDVAWANKILAKYPLLAIRHGSIPKDHSIIYLNAAYAAERS